MTAPRRARTVATLTAAVLAISACTGSDGDAGEVASTISESAVSTDAATTTTTTTTTTTVPVTTTTELETATIEEPDAPGESTTTVAIPDPEIPVSTKFDPSTVEGEIEQVVLSDTEAFKDCLRDLQACDLDVATRFAAFDYRDGQQRRLGQLIDDGWAVDDVDTIVRTVEGMNFGESGVEVEVQLCSVIGIVLRFPAEGEPTTVVNNFTTAKRQFLLTRLNDEWKITDTVTFESSDDPGRDLCA